MSKTLRRSPGMRRTLSTTSSAPSPENIAIPGLTDAARMKGNDRPWRCAQAAILHQAASAGRAVYFAIQACDQLRVVDEAIDGAADAWDERKCWNPISERKRNLVEPGLVLARVRSHYPGRVRMLLDRTLLETDLRLDLALRIDAGSAQPITDASLVHEVCEVELRGLAKQVAREVSV